MKWYKGTSTNRDYFLINKITDIPVLTQDLIVVKNHFYLSHLGAHSLFLFIDYLPKYKVLLLLKPHSASTRRGEVSHGERIVYEN